MALRESQKYRVIAADCPWAFNDKLKMSDVKRGAQANYDTMPLGAIAGLNLQGWVKEDSLLAMWVPSSLLTEGLIIMKGWGFVHKQIVTWVKTSKGEGVVDAPREDMSMAFGMGRYFRGVTEHALIGTRGKVSKLVKSKSERNIILHPAMPHSQKPEALQDMLERILPKGPYLEMFARRARPGWDCVGLESEHIKADLTTWEPGQWPQKTKRIA